MCAKKMEHECKKFSRRKAIKPWNQIYEEIYRTIDSWVTDDASYLGEKSEIGKKCSNYLDNAYLGEIVFLCNENNEREYINDYKKYLSDTVRALISVLEEKSKTTAIQVTGIIQDINHEVIKKFSGIVEMQGNIGNKELKSLINVESEVKKMCTELVDRLSGAVNNRDLLEKIVKEYKDKFKNYEGQLK